MRDWVKWHQDYERPGSPLARRLQVVCARLNEALDSVAPYPLVLSLCAGDGRDVISVLKDRPGRVGRAVLVEREPALAARAIQAAKSVGLTAIEVRCQDAGAVDSFIDLLPVDVLLLCGVFGNIDHAQVKTIVDLAPAMIKEGGYVIWTRGGSEPDRRPEVRHWLTEAGLEEIAFHGPPDTYGVGLNRMGRQGLPKQSLPSRLFTFT